MAQPPRAARRAGIKRTAEQRSAGSSLTTTPEKQKSGEPLIVGEDTTVEGSGLDSSSTSKPFRTDTRGNKKRKASPSPGRGLDFGEPGLANATRLEAVSGNPKFGVRRFRGVSSATQERSKPQTGINPRRVANSQTRRAAPGWMPPQSNGRNIIVAVTKRTENASVHLGPNACVGRRTVSHQPAALA